MSKQVNLQIVRIRSLNQADSDSEINENLDISNSYCRCCFHIFTPKCNRNAADNDFIVLIRKIFYFQIKYKHGLSWKICDKCKDTIDHFWKFKTAFAENQAKFSKLVANGFSQDINKIRTISSAAKEDSLKLDENTLKIEENVLEQEMVLIKEEPLDLPVLNSIFIVTEHDQVKTETAVRKSIRVKETKPFVIEKPKTPKDKVCKDCGKMYACLEAHRIKMHGELRLHKCRSCRFSSYNRKELVDHEHEFHSRTKKVAQKCPYCSKLFQTLDQHIANVHQRGKKIFCDLCDYSSYKLLAIESHMKHNHLPKDVHCPQCDYKTISDYRLQNHVRNIHETNLPNEELHCAECNKYFKKKTSRESHMDRIHRQIALTFKCKDPDCKKYFFTASEMNQHYMNIHGPRNFICHVCAATFATMSVLTKHSSIHREFRFTCDLCNKKFDTRNRLSTHIKRHHTFEKDRKCHLCEKAFYGIRDLNYHVAVKHFGIKFKCGVAGCKSSLSRRDAYFNHLKSHKELTVEELKELHKKADDFCREHNLRK